MTVTIRIAGEAGQGVLTTGGLLVQTLAELGLHVAATRSYMSRIRGGLNWYDIRIGESPLWAPAERANLLVALTDTAMETLAGDLANGGVVLYNGAEADGSIAIDLAGVAKELGGSALYANTVAAGAVLALLAYPLDALEALLAKEFAKKGPEVVEANRACARRGAELVAGSAGALPAPATGGQRAGSIYDGATAIGLSAAVAGVKFVTAYPMTPGTATFACLAGLADRYGIVVEQAEDEIAAVNMLCGATYAGAPALTATSGGGFALMAEGLSLAGMMELPIVAVVAQRPGPATGLPTRTGQQDLAFAVSAGHGEFPRAVFAPGTVRQCYDLTRRALETAHAFQTPVVLLTDQFLQDLQQTLDELPAEPDPIDRHVVTAGSDYQRYAETDSGVSPRALPGGEAMVVCDSDSHTADGHLTEDLDAHVAQQDKRSRKLAGMTAAALAPQRHGPPDAATLLLTWGSTYGPAREAVDELRSAGESVAMLHFAQLWPIDAAGVRETIGSPERIVCVEGNATGQLAALLRSVGALDDCELHLRYDGLPMTGTEIAERIRP